MASPTDDSDENYEIQKSSEKIKHWTIFFFSEFMHILDMMNVLKVSIFASFRESLLLS